MKRQEGVAVLALLMIVAMIALIGLGAILDRLSKQRIVEARFWFDRVTFEASGLEGRITEEEQEKIRSMALSELRTAYNGLRVSFSENLRGFYRVRVIQQYPPRPGPPSPVGQSRPIGMRGGEGTVSFQAVAALAIPLRAAERMATLNSF